MTVIHCSMLDPNYYQNHDNFLSLVRTCVFLLSVSDLARVLTDQVAHYLSPPGNGGFFSFPCGGDSLCNHFMLLLGPAQRAAVRRGRWAASHSHNTSTESKFRQRLLHEHEFWRQWNIPCTDSKILLSLRKKSRHKLQICNFAQCPVYVLTVRLFLRKVLCNTEGTFGFCLYHVLHF